MPSLSGMRLDIVSLVQGKYANLSHSKQGMSQAHSVLARLASRQYHTSDFPSDGCLLVHHMARCLRCLSLQGVRNLFIPLLIKVCVLPE